MANYDLTYEGSEVQGILDTGEKLKADGYILMGGASPSTLPGTPTKRVAYIGGPGTYSNFGSTVVVPSGSIGVFKYDDSQWVCTVISPTVPVSTTVQDNDTTVPTGKAVKNAVDGAVDTLQGLIDGITDNIENGYVYAGIATPSTEPVTGKVFYLALQAGQYTHFDNTAVMQGVNIFKYNGSSWLHDAYVGISDKPIPSDTGLVKAGGTFDFVMDNGSAFDISKYFASGSTLATYENLSAALTDLDGLDAAYKRGGMSIRFVQSSDNKYVRYNLLADSFTTDTAQWAIADDGIYVENPEFVYVKTDKDDKILWAIKTDGGIYYGAGVPQQVIDYIEEKIADLSLDEYEDIVAFLDDLEKGDDTLQDLLDKKVDGEYVENLEFIEIITDSEDKILEGIREDGTKVIGGDINIGGSAKILGNMEVSGVSYKVVKSPEYLAAWVDASDKVIFGLKTDGKTYVGDADFLNEIKNNQEGIDEIKSYLANFDNLDIDALSSITAVESPEFIEAKTDSEGKLLAGRTPDGAAFENVGFSAPKVSIDGTTIENIEDPEGRTEIKTDSEGKILSYRDSEGVMHENVGIVLDNLKVRNLIINKPNPTEKTEVYLERPKFAEFWFYGNLPKDKSNNRTPTTLDFIYKVNGQILFSSKCTLAIQGHGSASYPKLGYTFEPISAEGEAIDIKWGDMIAVDSFHLKAYFTDETHSRGIAGGKVWTNMIKALSYPYNKINNKPLNVKDGQKIDSYCIADAKYSEDGFPVAFYINDEFHGLFTLKLKKNRKNYGMQKDNKNEIFLDCRGYDVSYGHSGKLEDPFDAGAWDLKNPKLKNYKEGDEITDATVLANIERLFDFLNNLSTRYSEYQDYIVLPHWIVWYVFSEVIGNRDVDGNNLELLTWDGTHWSLLPYDFDNTVGLNGGDGQIHTSWTGIILNYGFYNTFRNCYETEIKEMYTMLRKKGVLDLSNLYHIYISQIDSIPRYIYDKDRELWPANGYWNGDIPTVEQIYFFFQSRLEYLDSVWLLDSNNN